MLEIERKFRIDGFPDGYPRTYHAFVEQGYLCLEPEVRIRRNTRENGEVSCKLCIKSDGDISRTEVETPITPEQFEALAGMLKKKPVTKDFSIYDIGGGLELEVSHVDAHKPDGFFYAEIEFPTLEAAQSFVPLPCLGEELTYKSSAKMKHYWEKGTI